MNDRRMTFSIEQGTPPIVSLLPGMEALLSCRLGDDPEPLWTFWKHLVRDILPNAPYVFDTRQEKGELKPATSQHIQDIQDAFRQACRGHNPSHRIEWATLSFHDRLHENEVPSYSCSCSIGWIISPEEPRGFSLRITAPHDAVPKLGVLGQELALGWPGIWRWISIGYRFVTVPIYSSLIESAIRITNGRSRRFIGADVGDTFGLLTSYWQDYIRTVNWITIISPELLRKTNEQQILELSSASSIEIKRLGKGLWLRAGEKPSLCDVNRREDPTAYQLMDKVLLNVRASDPIAFFPLLNDERTHDWLNRWKTVRGGK
jgi:hypothetical protein